VSLRKATTRHALPSLKNTARCHCRRRGGGVRVPRTVAPQLLYLRATNFRACDVPQGQVGASGAICPTCGFGASQTFKSNVGASPRLFYRVLCFHRHSRFVRSNMLRRPLAQRILCLGNALTSRGGGMFCRRPQRVQSGEDKRTADPKVASPCGMVPSTSAIAGKMPALDLSGPGMTYYPSNRKVKGSFSKSQWPWQNGLARATSLS